MADCRHSKAAAQRASQGKVIRNAAPNSYFTVNGFIEFFIILEADRRTNGRVCSQISFQIHIGGVTAPVGLSHEIGMKTWKTVRPDSELIPINQRRIGVFAMVEPRVFFPGLDLVILRAIFESEGEVQGFVGSQKEFLREIQIEGVVHLGITASLVRHGNVFSEVDELRIYGIPNGKFRAMLSDHSANIVVPVVFQHSLDAGTYSHIGSHSAELRSKTAGKQHPRIESRTVAQFGYRRKKPPALGLAVPESLFHFSFRDVRKNVEMRAIADVKPHITEKLEFVIHFRNTPMLGRHRNAFSHRDHILPGQTTVDFLLGQWGVGIGTKFIAAIDVRLSVGSLNTSTGWVHLGVFETQIGEPFFGQRQSDIGRHGIRIPVAFVKLSPASLQFAAAGGILEDEIHHPGHGVRTVLSRGTVTQDFHPLNRDRRNDRKIRTMGTVRHPGSEDIDYRSSMTAFAVDQRQSGIAGQPS